jgi:hypothetical protein
MPDDRHIFLTHAQAKSAIVADLKQYAPQKDLFRNLSTILLNKHTVIDTGDGDGVWIETGKLGKMRKIPWETLRRHLCEAVDALPQDLPFMARLLSRVFDGKARVGTDETGRRDGVWLETGMDDFNCRRCGQCCRSLDYHEQCSVADVRKWRLAGRTDLIARARPVRLGGRIDHFRIWTSLTEKRPGKPAPGSNPTARGISSAASRRTSPRFAGTIPAAGNMRGLRGVRDSKMMYNACLPATAAQRLPEQNTSTGNPHDIRKAHHYHAG